jgi:hypothetical protein
MTQSSPHSYPNRVLTKIVGKPSSASFKKLQTELYDNAMSIPSNCGGGGGAHGHLATIMALAEVNVMLGPGNQWEDPVNRGITPDILSINATQFHTADNNCAFAADIVEWNTYLSTSRALNTQLISAINSTFIDELKHDTLGSASTSCRARLDHLQSTYARITPAQLNKNEQELSREWDPSQVPIENLWIRLKECRCLAAAGHDPISKATAMRKTLNSIKQTGQFEDAVLDWPKTPEADQLYASFKVHFKTTNVKCKQKVTAHSGGYRGANVATTSNIEASLRADIHAKYAASAAATAALAATHTPLDQASPHTRTKACPITTNWSYCWTHGLSCDSTHNSNSCPRKRGGHKATATVDNMLGDNPMISCNADEKLNDHFMFTYNN